MTNTKPQIQEDENNKDKQQKVQNPTPPKHPLPRKVIKLVKTKYKEKILRHPKGKKVR